MCQAWDTEKAAGESALMNPITARELAEQLLEHPDAVVQVALPGEFYVLGVGTHIANADGSLEPPCENGVALLAVTLPDPL